MPDLHPVRFCLRCVNPAEVDWAVLARGSWDKPLYTFGLRSDSLFASGCYCRCFFLTGLLLLLLLLLLRGRGQNRLTTTTSLTTPKAYTAGQQEAQMLRDICGWLNINSMRAEKVGIHRKFVRLPLANVEYYYCLGRGGNSVGREKHHTHIALHFHTRDKPWRYITSHRTTYVRHTTLDNVAGPMEPSDGATGL